MVIIMVTLIITPLITAHEPSSRPYTYTTLEPKPKSTWVVVKIRVPFWVPQIVGAVLY